MTETITVAARTSGNAISNTELKAVVYGPKQESISLQIDKKKAAKLYTDAGESTIIVLEGLDEPIEVLIQDVDIDPLTHEIRHIDFYAFERGKDITANIPLVFTGTPPAEEKEGVLAKQLHEVEVSCRPSALPHEIAVDVSVLAEVGDTITIADLALSEGVTATHESDEIVAQIVAVREEEEEETEVGFDSIEVESKGKEEGGESEGAEATE